MARGDFLGVDAATLQELKNDYLKAIKAVALAGVSYAIAVRSFTRTNLGELK